MTPFESVADYIQRQAEVSQYCVAYSGGMDSHVLLFLMSQLKQEDPALQLRAVHVNHGLQADCEHWAEHAQVVCDKLEIPLEVRLAIVDDQSQGPEAAARKARYAEFSDILRPGEHLLLAQHAEDQAETFLLQALRGSGLDGLSGIPRKRRFSGGHLGRPLLACSRESLSNVATTHDLTWIEDPSNTDDKFDRNYLRLNVMPLLKERWPAYAQTMGRSALRSAAASQALLGLAQQDLAAIRIEGTSELSIAGLNSLPKERAFTVLRLFVRQRELRMPRLQDLMQVMKNLVDARSDSNGIVNVRDYVFRRHKDSLYVLPQQKDTSPFHYTWDAPYNPLTIRETGLTLTRALCHEQGLHLPSVGPVIVKSRAGGELLKMGEPAFHKSVKKILQESSLPPWVRDTIPLIYSDGRLAAVLGIAISVHFQNADAHTVGDVADDGSIGNLIDRTRS
jgi:tRNA(Ile)-lysidine synthase